MAAAALAMAAVAAVLAAVLAKAAGATLVLAAACAATAVARTPTPRSVAASRVGAVPRLLPRRAMEVAAAVAVVAAVVAAAVAGHTSLPRAARIPGRDLPRAGWPAPSLTPRPILTGLCYIIPTRPLPTFLLRAGLCF